MSKIKEWTHRYLPAEACATVTAIVGASLIYLLTGNRAIAAFAGAIYENIGYYGYISTREIKTNIKKYKAAGKYFGFAGYTKTIRDMIFEFGLSEVLDSFIVRPFCMYWLPILIPNFAVGIFIGKVVADIIFYIPTIISYELKKKYITN